MVEDHGHWVLDAARARHRSLERERGAIVQQERTAVRRGVRGVLSNLRDLHDMDPTCRAFDQEADVDAADVIAFFEERVVFRIRLGIANRVGADLDRKPPQHGEVLHFDDAKNIRRAQHMADCERRLGQPPIQRVRREDCVVARGIINVVEEPLQVVVPDCELTRRRRRHGDRCRIACRCPRCAADRGRVGQNRVAPGRVIERSGNGGQDLAGDGLNPACAG